MLTWKSMTSRLRPRRLASHHVCCDLCGADKNKIVGTRDRYGAPLVNVVCLDCGLVFTNPMPTDDALAGYYREEYRFHYQGEREPRAKHLTRGKRRARERVDLIAPHLRADAHVLDIGAGAGEFVAAARTHGWSARGLEPSTDFAAYARRHFDVDVRQGGWQDARAGDAGVDLVAMHHVVEHLAHPRDAFLHVRGLLADGGLFYVSVPDVLDRERSPHGRWHVGHVHNFSPGTLDAMAARTGFSPIAGAMTTRVYRKTALPQAWRPDPDLARDILQALDQHTPSRHFTSFKPYARFLERGLRHARETLGSM